MRLCRLALAALLVATALPASAQMVDPRQMSGIPRPDAQVAVGKATVRLIQGEMSRNAPAGTVVHLVALHPDGSATRESKPIDKEGRAAFEGMATDGSIAYYAFALLGEDRLESQLLVLDKMAGVRLMLAGRAVKDGAPVGEPIDDAVNPEQPVRVPAGEVWVLVGGRVAAGLEVEVVEVAEAGQAGSGRSWKAKAEPVGEGQMVAKITGVPDGADRVYVARVQGQARPFVSKPFMMKPGVGAGRTILVVDQIIVTAHIAMELDDETMRVQVQYMLQNFSGGPLDLGADGLKLPLPAGAVGGSLSEEGKAKINPGKEIIWRGVLPPGSNEIIAAFGLPVDDGTLVFDMPTPLGLFQSTLIVEQAASATMVPPPGTQAQVRTADNGRKFFVVGNLQIPAGGSVRFTVTGLPKRPFSEKLGKWAAGAVVLIFMLGALAVAIWNPWAPRPGGQAGASASGGKGGAARRKELTSRREQLYAELVELERRRAAAGIEEERYMTQRKAVVNRLSLVLRELDQLDGDGGGAAGAKTS